MATPTTRGPASQTFIANALDASRAMPLTRQLYEEIRSAILEGRLVPGARLPSTRTLAAELGLARNTVLDAYEQLTAEGYLSGLVGSGTRVADASPEDVLGLPGGKGAPAPAGARAGNARGDARSSRPARLSERGRMLSTTSVRLARDAGSAKPFRLGVPALELFPFEIWKKLTGRFWDRPSERTLGYDEPAGLPRLREAIALHLRASRAVRCEPEQVIVVSGSQQALDLVGRLVLDPDDPVWIEDPGYLGARAAFTAAGARLVPVPVDDEGLDVGRALRTEPNARLAYVTPSHHFPTGVVLSRARRLALLEWARARGAWIVEDDYDSEYRYEGWPLESLQGIDGGERVLYVGTFSKVLFPALRLGYLVVPRALVGAFANARALSDRQPPGPDQAVLAEFIARGHFARHLRRMRVLYGGRQGALLAAVRRELADRVEIGASPMGMHLLARVPEGVDDRVASHAAQAHGVEASPLSGYALKPLARGGLVLGYAPFDEAAIEAGVTALARALRDVVPVRGDRPARPPRRARA
ncbi:MAG: PLP-dependent aminotransferase family protein [Candidatus Eiseniibacteriota bacterium]